MAIELQTIGKSEIRKDAWDKVTGAARYVDDYPNDNLRVGLVLRSPHHHARIVSVDATAAEAVPGVVRVITAGDVPGAKTFGPIVADRPALAFDVVRHKGEPLAIVVAESKTAARRGLQAIDVQYEPLPAVFDALEALQEDAPQIHPEGNLVTEYDVGDGDPQQGFADADVIVEETFDVPRISPAYMEPESSMAAYNDDGTLTVWVSSQKPFEDRHKIAETLGVEDEVIQVKGATIGGAFGGKEDSGLAILAALAAWVSRSNVRLVNNRHESFLAHPKRHPARLHLRLGARQDGTLLALEARVHMDTGAYASYGPAVGGLLTEMVQGAYRIPHVRVNTLVVYTNSPFSGAMRGFGSPQAHFATESLLDMLAEKLTMDPLDLRRKNILQPGDQVFTRVQVEDTARSLPLVLHHVAEARERLQRKRAAAGRRCGVGFALSTQSMGLGYRVPDDSTNRLEWLPDGRVLVHLGAPDLGQGLEMVTEQMAAESLGLPYDAVHTAGLDTSTTPDGGVTCASRMTYVVGNSVAMAARKLIDALLDYAAQSLDVPRDSLSYENGMVQLPDGEALPVAEFTGRAADEGHTLAAQATFSFPYPEETTPKHLPFGMPHLMFCYGAQVARVEVDPQLGTVEVTDLVAIHDVGRIINRVGVEGQIEGAVVQGIGYALFEDVQLKQNGDWVDGFAEYLLPTTEDVPTRIESVILEIPEESGPFGAKGVAEMGLVPTAAAIANAVHDAVDIRVTRIPITP
ncbi:MAG: xanthine dehydrogenase family protein molybdopterin-binding subunit, partial [bacterium]